MSDTFSASAGPGVVVIVMDPAIAYQLADAWELANASGALVPGRPEFLLEAAGIKRAAINAERQAGEVPVPVSMVDATPRHLSVVGDL